MSASSRRRRRYWSPNEKIRIVREAMQDENTFASIAKKYGIQPHQIRDWKGQMQIGNSDMSKSDRKSKIDAALANDVDNAVFDIRLTVTFKFEIV